jgi:hypothetical protein
MTMSPAPFEDFFARLATLALAPSAMTLVDFVRRSPISQAGVLQSVKPKFGLVEGEHDDSIPSPPGGCYEVKYVTVTLMMDEG